jgi:outer membrane cobalamin receptor
VLARVPRRGLDRPQRRPGEWTLNFTPPFIYNNSFDLLYDNAGVANISAELTYVKDKDYYFSLKGNYYDYALDHLSFAPQLSNFEIKGSAEYRINDKVRGFSDLKVTGNRYGLILNSDGDLKYNLKPIYLLNTGADYELRQNLKIFGRIDNLLSQHYEQLPGYTSQGIRVIAGINLSF